eukprot:GHVU01021942.1.p2 GENE.GHVU01021942.1~~GHVU01021942.1.p2  ORF type:complete len:126 (-),score=4.71 GHVU01021942.1:301-678(-)
MHRQSRTRINRMATRRTSVIHPVKAATWQMSLELHLHVSASVCVCGWIGEGISSQWTSVKRVPSPQSCVVRRRALGVPTDILPAQDERDGHPEGVVGRRMPIIAAIKAASAAIDELMRGTDTEAR